MELTKIAMQSGREKPAARRKSESRHAEKGKGTDMTRLKKDGKRPVFHRWAAGLLALLFLALIPSCSRGKTLDDITWSLTVEGAEKTVYTREEAEKHDLSHMIVSMFVRFDMRNDYKNRTPNGSTGGRVSFRVDGITLAEFLEDVGRPDAVRVTYYGETYDGKEVIFTIEEEELLKGDRVMIAWIMNKEYILPNYTETYVGVFGDSDLLDFVSCCSVSRIVIE